MSSQVFYYSIVALCGCVNMVCVCVCGLYLSTHIYSVCMFPKKLKCIKQDLITLWVRIKGKRQLWVKTYVGISVENYDIRKNYNVYIFDPIFLPVGNSL